MSTNTITLVQRQRHGWRMGLASMLAKENFAWWRTRRWWLQSLIALLILNGSLALNMKDSSMQRIADQVMNFLMTAALFIPIIAAILVQDAILDERHSGTTAWVLSKPLGRSSFILSKVIAYGLGLFITWVLIPFIVMYIQVVAAGLKEIAIPGFAGLIGLAYLNLLFYMTLSIMLATLFNSRLPGLAISIFIAWSGPLMMMAQPIERYVPWLEDILPWRLIAILGQDIPLGVLLAIGEPLPTVVPIFMTGLWCVLFISVAIWRFHREEY